MVFSGPENTKCFFFGSGGSRRNDLIRSTPLVIKQGEFSSIDRNDFPMKTFVYFDFFFVQLAYGTARRLHHCRLVEKNSLFRGSMTNLEGAVPVFVYIVEAIKQACMVMSDGFKSLPCFATHQTSHPQKI